MDLDKKQFWAVLVSALLLLTWILVPLISQYYYGYSAIEVSFAITTVYFVGFQLWKRFLKE